MTGQRAGWASRLGRFLLVVAPWAGPAFTPCTTQAQWGGRFSGIYDPSYTSGFNYGSFGGSMVNGMGFGMGYPGMGFGGMGFGGMGMGFYGGMGLGAMGMSPYEQAMYKQHMAQQSISSVNLQNAQAAAAMEQANFYRQQAQNLALANAQKARGIQPKYRTNSGAISEVAAAEDAAPAPTPTPKFLASDGTVNWPEFAIDNKDRAKVDQAVAKVVSEKKAGGHASVASIAQAKQLLRNYGHPALRLDRVQSRPKLVKDLARFLNAVNDYLSDAADDAEAANKG